MTLLILFCYAAAGYGQPCVSLKGFFTPAGLIDRVEDQWHGDINYRPDEIYDTTHIWVEMYKASPEAVLTAGLLGLRVKIDRIRREKRIYIRKTPGEDTSLYVPFRGRVLTPDSQAIADVNISVDGLSDLVHTDEDGAFSFYVRTRRAHIKVSYAGYTSCDTSVVNIEPIRICLQPGKQNATAFVKHQYGGMTKRPLVTANIDAAAIPDNGPEIYTNPLDFLQSYIPGLDIRRMNGTPGSFYTVLIRGQNSIAQGRDPLILVDGVPIAGYNSYLSHIGSGSAQGVMGASVLNSIDLSNIASIEVYKDALATSIYGSRGANGVINITLRQSTGGKLQFTFNSYYGISKAPMGTKMLNTQQFLQLREEALKNDGLPVNDESFPERKWGTVQNIDARKLAFGNTGTVRSARLHAGWGDTRSSMLLTGHYTRESTVFSRPTKDEHISLYGNFKHQSGNGRWHFNLSELFSSEVNALPAMDPTLFGMTADPNMPAPYDAGGRPLWQRDSVSFLNIPQVQLYRYTGKVINLYHHLQLSYRSRWGIVFKGSLGYNTVSAQEKNLLTIESQDPATDPRAAGLLTTNKYSSAIAEFTPEYTWRKGRSRLETLLGSTWQQEENHLLTLSREGYTSTLALTSGSPAPSTTSTENAVQYRYGALFGRVNYSWADKYIGSFTWRRDGSSRFAPDHRMGNFWAVGAAWVLSEEPWMQKFGWLNLAKLRGSYGITGNDLVGDEQYEQSYRSTSAPRGYQGLPGVRPISFYNGELAWELNHKLEAAIDLQALNGKLDLSASIYHHWTTNQLVYQSLPSQTGLPGVIANQQAMVVNDGIEGTLRVRLGGEKELRWMSDITVTLQRNYLRSFSGLGTTAYAGSLILGRSLNVVNGFLLQGVDGQTGLSRFADVTPDNVLDARDRRPIGSLDMPLYGSWKNVLKLEDWELDLLLNVRFQHAPNPLVTWLVQNPPGVQAPSGLGNMPVDFLRRWTRPGDVTDIQRLTADPGSQAASLIPYLAASNFSVVDGSYLRVKELSLIRQLPRRWLKGMGFTRGCVYISGENMATMTGYHGADPETRDPLSLPVLRKWVTGIQLNF